ncbi:MAG: MFS transporter, partial [Candidatus Aminicenantes bacterium]
NLWKIYAYKLLSEFWVIVPILIPYYQSNNLNKTQIFTIQAAYALSILIMEIPSGYLADIIGRRKTLILGALFMPVGIGVYVFTNNFYTFLVAEFIIAISNSMRSGCDSALVYDTLIQLKKESEYKKFEGRSFYYARLGTAISSILGGLLALLSLNLPFYANMATSALLFPLALTLIEPHRKKLDTVRPFKDILRISRYCFTHPKLRLFILFMSLIRSTGITGIWAYFLYYDSIGISLGYFGVIFAAYQLCSAFGSRHAHIMETKIGQKASLYILLLIAPTFILLGLIKTPLVLPLIFLNAFLLGVAFPLLLDSMNRLIESDVRATALSVANMTGSLSFVIVSPLFGKLVDVLSLSEAFIIMGLFFIVYGSLNAVKIARNI